MMAVLDRVRRLLEEGAAVPVLGAGVLDAEVPTTHSQLATALSSRVAVPGRIRHDPWATAQYIESRRHRVTLTKVMGEIFAPEIPPTTVHRYLAGIAALPMIVSLWYDDTMACALAGRNDWGRIQGVSRAEHRDDWWHVFDAEGNRAVPGAEAAWATLLYEPWGAVRPSANFLVADSDFVEVLTELDIQTPIPEGVQRRRTGKSFVFLGCRFDDMTTRQFARQIMKRSSDAHFAVMEGPLTRNEERFLTEFRIRRIDMSLAEAGAEIS